MNELPVASITRKPVRSRMSATGSAIPACIRIPHRLCWPSRSVVSSSSTCDMLNPFQLVLQDLAGAVAGKLPDDDVPPRTLVARDRVEAARVERGGVDLRPVPGNDERDDALAPLVVRGAHHRGLGDRRLTEENALDFARVDVVPAGDHDVLRPVHEREEAPVIEVAEIAG